MKIETYILLVQAMQLPVVALIIIFSFNSSIANAISEYKYQNYFISNIRGLIKNNPLRFIALGLVSNLFYLLIKIRTGSLASDEINKISTNSLIVLFDVITAFFFLTESAIFFIQEDTGNDNPRRTYINTNKSRNVKLVVLIISLLISFFIVFENWKKVNLSLYVFDFIVYLFVSLYLLRKIRIRDNQRKSIYSNYFVFFGFLFWALLQLLSPFGKDLKIDEKEIELIGFSISTISKALILFGLYDFSIKIAKYATLNQQEINRELLDKVISIDALPDLINSISNSKNVNQLAKNITEHLTDGRVFNFEYAIFSEVNYLKQKITFKEAKTLNPKIKLIEEWVLKDGIPFEHHDIMALVVRERKTIHVFRDKLSYFDPVKAIDSDINSESSPLNKDVYTKYNHQTLDRFFIPVLNLTDNHISNGKDKGASTNRVVAIIEAGYYAPMIKDYLQKTLSPKGELNIYLDNCSQSFERLFDQEIVAKTSSIIKVCDEQSKDDHLEYLRLVMQSTCNLVNADYGFISLYSINKTSHHAKLIFPIDDKIIEKDKIKLATILNNSIEYDVSNAKEVRINELKIEKEALEYLKAKSFQVNKIIVHEHTIGFIFLFSKNPFLFNEVVQSIISRIADDITTTYNEKKFHNSVAALVTPDNAITDLEVNMQPIINMLQDYFETPYICIWLKDDSGLYIQKYASKDFKESCRKFGYTKISINEISIIEDYSIVTLDSESPTQSNAPFWEYGHKNKFKTLLHKPIKTQHQNFGFINLYFKNDLKQPLYEDISFLNLVSVKGLITMQVHNLVKAFRDISDSFTKNDLKTTLQTITDSAMGLLNADPVILFKSGNGEDVFFNDVTYSYVEEFKDKEILQLFINKKDSHVELAELIIRDKTMFFGNHLEYEQYVGRHSKKHEQVHFKKDFWNREGIQSMAAIRLINKIKNKSKPVGVMFINFRNAITFNEETKRIIETFAALASGSISNGYVFQRNRQYLLHNLRMAKPMLAEVLAAGALHDAHKTFKAINSMYFHLIKDIDNPGYGNKSMSMIDTRAELSKMEPSIRDLFNQFQKLSALYKPNETLQIKNCSITKIIKDQLENLETELSEKLIHLHDSFSKNNISIDCDEILIGNVLFNIINNAYQAMEKRGNLEIRLIETSDNKVKIDIIDDGKGISEDIKDIITEPYVTDKTDGSGLGLAMSKLTIEQHRGHLSYSTRNKKTTFSILLPKRFDENIN